MIRRNGAGDLQKGEKYVHLDISLSAATDLYGKVL